MVYETEMEISGYLMLNDNIKYFIWSWSQACISPFYRIFKIFIICWFGVSVKYQDVLYLLAQLFAGFTTSSVGEEV